MKRNGLVVSLITAGVIATVGATGWFASDWQRTAPHVVQQPPAVAAQATLLPRQPADMTPIGPMTAPNYREIVLRYSPAVVGINTSGTTRASVDDDSMPEDLPYFFRGIPGMPRPMPRDEVPVRGQGSGFIVSEDGLILTNAHVVRDASEVTVKLSDRREYKAKVLGSDVATDIAVLKIAATDLPVVRLGQPAQLGVGDYVLAIGSPFGFEQSASAGIVSAKGRSLPGDGFVPFIQTDVAVNPGNSGGPLFDSTGAVVGINSQIYSRTGGFQGVSFAIPIDVALNVKEQIVTTGKVVHARLGVTVQEMNQTLAESFKLTRPDGALVSSVMAGSPAAKSGLEPGDVILSFNANPIGRSSDLPALVSMEKPGSKALIGVWRDGKNMELSVMLAESKQLVANNDIEPKLTSQGKLGLAVRPLSAAEKAATRLPSGLVVENATGPAARGGVEAGDVILAINGTSVHTIEQLQAIISNERNQLALLIQRGDARIFIPIRVG